MYPKLKPKLDLILTHLTKKTVFTSAEHVTFLLLPPKGRRSNRFENLWIKAAASFLSPFAHCTFFTPYAQEVGELLISCTILTKSMAQGKLWFIITTLGFGWMLSKTWFPHYSELHGRLTVYPNSGKVYLAHVWSTYVEGLTLPTSIKLFFPALCWDRPSLFSRFNHLSLIMFSLMFSRLAAARHPAFTHGVCVCLFTVWLTECPHPAASLTSIKRWVASVNYR